VAKGTHARFFSSWVTQGSSVVLWDSFCAATLYWKDSTEFALSDALVWLQLTTMSDVPYRFQKTGGDGPWHVTLLRYWFFMAEG